MRRVAISRVLAVLLLSLGSLFAQEFSFRTFGNPEGLSNLAVRQLYEDRAGFIWVSTENGIFRYDAETASRLLARHKDSRRPPEPRLVKLQTGPCSPAGASGSIAFAVIVSKNFQELSRQSAGRKGSSRTGEATLSLAPTPV